MNIKQISLISLGFCVLSVVSACGLTDDGSVSPATTSKSSSSIVGGNSSSSVPINKAVDMQWVMMGETNHSCTEFSKELTVAAKAQVDSVGQIMKAFGGTMTYTSACATSGVVAKCANAGGDSTSQADAAKAGMSGVTYTRFYYTAQDDWAEDSTDCVAAKGTFSKN